MALSEGRESSAEAQAAVAGRKITAVTYGQDFLEVRFGELILTGLTEPFGIIGCTGVGPGTVHHLIGRKVEELTIVDGQYVAIDSGENRLAFPIRVPTAPGSESVRLVRPAQPSLGIERAVWVW